MLPAEDWADVDEEGVGLLGYVYLTRRGLDRELDWLGGLGTALGEMGMDGLPGTPMMTVRRRWSSDERCPEGSRPDALAVGCFIRLTWCSRRDGFSRGRRTTIVSRLSCLVPCVLTR
jgi:hypothetical protein